MQTLSNFNGGEYLTYNITGEVDITVTKTAGSNAVISGLFFDAAGTIAAPTNLQTIASPGQVEINWTAAPSGGTYNVVRTDSDGNSTTVATGVTGTSYTDTTATNGETFTYALSTSSDGIAGPLSSSSDQATPGGVWVSVATETPDIMSNTLSGFGSSTLPAGTYRVDYTSGAMTYSDASAGNQGYRVNAFTDGGDGFEVAKDGNEIPSTDIHAPGTEATASTAVSSFSEIDGDAFPFTGGTLGIYLHDSPYGDNASGSGTTPTFKLEELLTETSLTAADVLSGSSATTNSGSSGTPLVYSLDSSGNATISLSTTTSPTSLPTGYSEFYQIAGTGGAPVSSSFNTTGPTDVVIPAGLAASPLMIQTGIGPSSGSSFATPAQQLQARPNGIALTGFNTNNNNTDVITYNGAAGGGTAGVLSGMDIHNQVVDLPTVKTTGNTPSVVITSTTANNAPPPAGLSVSVSSSNAWSGNNNDCLIDFAVSLPANFHGDIMVLVNLSPVPTGYAASTPATFIIHVP